MKTIILLVLTICTLLPTAVTAQELTEAIRVNQIGFYPDGPKIAIVAGGGRSAFSIMTADMGRTVFTGTLGTPSVWPYSEETVQAADFSAVTTPGEYVLVVPGLGKSYPFAIARNVHDGVTKGVIKGYYFQRATTPLPERYAGKWSRPAGHMQDVDAATIHASAATAARPEGTLISSPWGWYDAGDYGQYIVNSGISTYEVLALYEHFPRYASGLNTDIPESGNDLPDVLDEALWNIRWMLTMQDPAEGGVYHKLTTANFSGFIMPHEDTATRYVVQKSVTATLDFAAVMAQSSRIFRAFPQQLPGFADSCRTAALNAWDWALANPDSLYIQSRLNQQFTPRINTGEYGDRSARDEFVWAAAELYVTTGDARFIRQVEDFAEFQPNVPSWGSVGTLGLITLAHYRESVGDAVDMAAISAKLITLADALMASYNSSAYKIVMGVNARDFVWGSNAVAANQGVILITAYNLTGDRKYLNAALSNLDYLLGRNATSYSFVTGFGDKPPMHIHHRPSEADGVVDPVPGLLSGGPNPSQQDNAEGYPSKLPALSFTDVTASYASNEICINWNAPMVYLTGAIEAIIGGDGR